MLRRERVFHAVLRFTSIALRVTSSKGFPSEGDLSSKSMHVRIKNIENLCLQNLLSSLLSCHQVAIYITLYALHNFHPCSDYEGNPFYFNTV